MDNRIIMQDKKIIVILVIYNGAQWISKNITSLLKSQLAVDVLAIDNKSTDNSVELIKKFPQVTLLEQDQNLGFGKANNLGMQWAVDHKYTHVFLLNQDTWIFPNTIKLLASFSEAHPEFGVVSPTHLSDAKGTLDAGFKTYLSRATTLDEVHAVVPFVNAAAWFMPVEVIEKVGYFEALFGHYGEDRNYMDRLAFHHYKAAVFHDALIVHDRVIKRNLSKDMTQSKYLILCQLLNPNNSLLSGFVQGGKSVFGLPKYFSKDYDQYEIKELFQDLAHFYLLQLKRVKLLKQARKNY